MINLKESNIDIESLIDTIDKKSDIIRKEKRLKQYPEIEKDLVEGYQKLIVPFLENYVESKSEINSEDEQSLRDDLLLFLKDLLDIIDITSDSLDEGVKDALLGALMSLSFMTPAKAQKTIDTLPGNMTSSKVQALAQDFKSAKNTIDVASIAKDYSGGKEATVSISKPSVYKPLTIEQRNDWNKYLKSLGDMAGSPELDKGVPSKGRQLLSDYLEDNPNSSLNDFSDQEDLVKSIQYEMQVIRKGNNASDLGIDGPDLEAMQDLLRIQRLPWMKVDLSKMDGNPGQYTTKSYYPFFGSAGTDYKKARGTIYKTLDYEKAKLKN